MSMPVGPIWAMGHLMIKFPLVSAALATSLYFYVQEDSKAMVAITFDDGWRSVHEIALPEMTQRGMVGTNYITTDFVTSGDPRYITQEQLHDFVVASWEIGAHSLAHDDLTTLNEEEVIRNIYLPQMFLSDWIGHPVTTFSTPYGSFNDMILGHADSAYITHVNAWSDAYGMNTPDTFNPNNINRIDTANISVPELCEVFAALQDNEFYAIIFHQITDVPGDYSMSPEDFYAVLDCIEDSNVQTVTISQGTLAMQDAAQ